MEDYGKQREIEDDKADPSGFLKKARKHQSQFRFGVLKLAEFDEYGNFLTIKDAENGNNFYNGFGVFEAVKKQNDFNKNLYQNMLRSEHIPFNLFVPLEKNKAFFMDVFNEVLNNKISSIDLLLIEYAPQPRENYLKDRTSFDVYIEYSCKDNSKGIIGIEIKYTERSYNIGQKEQAETENQESIYYDITKESNTEYSTSKCA